MSSRTSIIMFIFIFLFIVKMPLLADSICLNRIDVLDPSESTQIVFENERVKVSIDLSDVLKSVNELAKNPSTMAAVHNINSYTLFTKLIEKYNKVIIYINSPQSNDFEIESINNLKSSQYLIIVDSSGVNKYPSLYMQLREIYFSNLASGKVSIYSKNTGKYQSYIYVSDPFPHRGSKLTYVNYYFPNGERFCSGVESF